MKNVNIVQNCKMHMCCCPAACMKTVYFSYALCNGLFF